jgi:hypothetical protein
MVQYDDFLGGITRPALFFARDDALRIGPELVLSSWFTKEKLLPAFAWLSNLSSLITFHEAWDVYTSRNYKWAQASLTYDIKELNALFQDKTWHIGVTASYGYGNSETTGTLMSQAKLGLSIKH